MLYFKRLFYIKNGETFKTKNSMAEVIITDIMQALKAVSKGTKLSVI